MLRRLFGSRPSFSEEVALQLRDLNDRAFERDLAVRRRLGRQLYPRDDDLLEALEQGLPSCAGVAVGIDRLLLKMLCADSLSAVIPALALR